jgi:hypothetical protein
MAIATMVLSLLFWYVESGNECFIGTGPCRNSYGMELNLTALEAVFPAGKRVLLDDWGNVTAFGDFRSVGDYRRLLLVVSHTRTVQHTSCISELCMDARPSRRRTPPASASAS